MTNQQINKALNDLQQAIERNDTRTIVEMQETIDENALLLSAEQTDTYNQLINTLTNNIEKMNYNDRLSKEIRITNAILNGQKTITIDGKKHTLPSPQTSGTITQRKAYAGQWANKLLDSLTA